MKTTINLADVKEFLLENTDELRQIVSELNSWNGCLDHLEVYENDEYFFETFFDGKPMEAVRAAQYGDYQYMHPYVRFNGYGNLESLDDYEYEKELEDNVDEIIDSLITEQEHVDVSDELYDLLNPEEEEE